MQSDDIVERLRDCTCVPHGEICREAADEIERLRAERDEARRELCRNLMGAYGDEYKYAKHRGWDCFKKDGK